LVDSATKKTKTRARLPAAKLAPQVAAMKARGMTAKEIATAIDRSERQVWALLRYAKDSGESFIFEVPDPKAKGDLPAHCKPMLEDTSAGFEAFFNRYSGRTLQPVHKDWVKQALSSKRVLINCPPRHAKSTIFSVWFPIWLIARDRNLQILICSQTDKLAKKFTNEISYALSYNRDLIKDFGRFKPELGDWPWRPNSGELLVDGRTRETKSGDLSIQVRGAGQQILGMEAHWIIVDDAVDRPTTRSETEREKLSEWFHGDVMSRLEPGASCIVIGQRLHLFDLYGELAQEKLTRVPGSPKRWLHINYPAILDWTQQTVLWPEKWTYNDLMEVYQDVGSQNFEAMYQQNPLPAGERLAMPEWIYGDTEHRGCLDQHRKAGRASPFNPEDPRPRVRVLSMDPSPTKLAGLIVADILYDRDTFECEVLEVRHEPMNVRKMLGTIQSMLKNYGPVDYFIFEQNAAQRWLLQDPAMDRIRAKTMVLPHTTNRNKGDPTLGVGSLAVEFEFGRIRLPYGDAEGKEMSQLLLDEVMTWPQSQTDDILMALWFIKFNYMRLVPRRGALDAGDDHSGWGRGWRPPPRLIKGFRWQ